MTATQSAEALSEQLLPEWEIVQGPMHATPPFRFPVYASKCRPAVANALQGLMDENAKLNDMASVGESLMACLSG